MLKQEIKGTFCFTDWILRSMARIGIHIMKLMLA